MSIRNVILILYFAQLAFTILLRFISYMGDTSPEIHESILKYFTEEDIQNGIEYERRGFFASLASDLLDFTLAGLIVFTPLSVKLENYLLRKTNDRFYLSVALFLLILSFAKFLVELPFNFYFGYVLEHEFGFSAMTISDWIIFTGKSLAIGIVIMTLIGLGAAYILRKFQNVWKYLIPLGALILGLLFSVLFPILITPLFYEYHPIEEGNLKHKIVQLCDRAKIEVSEVYVINESKYSGHTNAYFTGWGSNRKIFLYDTLIKNHTEEEVISVLGHEIGHWTHNHQIKDIAISTLETLALCFIVSFIFLKTKREGKIPLKEFYSPSTLPFLFLILSLIGTITKPAWSTFSRMQEAEADMEALILTNDKKAFIGAEQKLAKDNKSRLNPNRWEVIYNHSHPTTLERIDMAEKYSAP
ncbi:peptidase, M48 family [Leptospira broomii serovar Hurstbridge str. 5399]|uniref:Peptidase, M48 family n=1 Tax=Leptospira broomii serovar Hurstbridge str. 5399 TaxID=1049789 RepID=T0GHP0_9LEPT|nr:M48 family metallopeptidase [Leptospira broomii]EQA46364.1 peptidase, M48 family [Leptospira broomii serovar Hurstbridge str. 5399]